MEELLNVVSEGIKKINTNIARNKKYFDYPFTSNCDHYYKLMLLHSQSQCWDQFLQLLVSFNEKRNVEFHKRSNDFERMMKNEKAGIPGFVTQATLTQIIDYMRTLEWKIDELVGVKIQNKEV
ncbi:hypothetical protein ASG89_30720 [Paenibacillus sp. Soil766]|uniref:hypothetical protein n=1 Tax=Paenibacillus sp. Soil766 TaxID=1736404 RepID=UPI00070C31C6|nr:hypothetical protein [Paenibacillus sp. Soil766]KRE96905.1 hypothetical protein ASG89_30720 [Paenibacillus sp. Soil766]